MAFNDTFIKKNIISWLNGQYGGQILYEKTTLNTVLNIYFVNTKLAHGEATYGAYSYMGT